jgi:DNA anti-recombination protein RmuC
MDPASAEQTELLRNIWNEMKALGQNLGGRIDETNARLDAVRNDLGARLDLTNTRIDETNSGIDGLRGDFVRALTDSQTRTATELNAVTEAVRGVGELLRLRTIEREQITAVLDEVAELRTRLERLERRAG